MDSRQQLVMERLEELGAVLVRQKKHLIYRMPTGRNVVLPNTPSDSRAWQNALSNLDRMYPRPKVEEEAEVDVEPIMKPKKAKPKREEPMITQPEAEEMKFEPRTCDEMTDCFPEWRGKERLCQEQKPRFGCGRRWWMERERSQWWNKRISESTPAAPCFMPTRCPICRAQRREQGNYVGTPASVPTPAPAAAVAAVPRLGNNGNNGNGHSTGNGNGAKLMSDEGLLTLAYLVMTRPDPGLQEKLAAGLRARFTGRDMTKALMEIIALQ